MGPPLPTPLIPADQAVFSVSGAATIHCSARTLYDAHIDTSTWGAWNTFVPAVRITSQPAGIPTSSTTLHLGTKMVFTVRMFGGSGPTNPSAEEVTQLPESPPDVTDPVGTTYALGWKTDAGALSGAVLWAERVVMIEKLGEGEGCAYSTHETFAGPGAYVLRLALGGTLQARFEDWTRDLKVYCEGKEGGNLS